MGFKPKKKDITVETKRIKKAVIREPVEEEEEEFEEEQEVETIEPTPKGKGDWVLMDIPTESTTMIYNVKTKTSVDGVLSALMIILNKLDEFDE